MGMSINDLIKDLQNIKPSLRELPVKIQGENGLLFEPRARVLLDKDQSMQDEPKQMIITYM